MIMNTFQQILRHFTAAMAVKTGFHQRDSDWVIRKSFEFNTDKQDARADT